MKGKNPYIGPRAFRQDETLYGRDREVRQMLELLIADRILLMYSPSGAGKTSLINAALIPALEQEEFNVLPVMRVSLELSPQEKEAAGNVNRYLLSALLSLDKTRAAAEQVSLAALSKMSFAQYLDNSKTNGKARMLIFDQFEELLTVDPTDQSAKDEFFEQVGTALRNRELWALFSMREDYLAGLDPFLRRIPTRLATTVRLDLLGHDASREAIQKPAKGAGMEFRDDAAEKLLDDLRAVLVQQSDGSMARQLGPYIEPVQLQVVCHRLWDNLSNEADTVTPADIETIGDVNGALAGYYADQVQAVAKKTKLASERTIREWFDHRLITEQATRGQVLKGPRASDGLPNDVIRPLIDAHLVRSEKRRGANWFELAHDRLIEPIQKNNSEWLKENLNDFQRQAALWDRQQRPDNLLVYGSGLVEAEEWVSSNPELTATESLFLDKCREARVQATKQREQDARLELKKRQARRNRTVATIMTSVSLIAVVALVLLFFSYKRVITQDNQLRVQHEKIQEEQEKLRLEQGKLLEETDKALRFEKQLRELEKTRSTQSVKKALAFLYKSKKAAGRQAENSQETGVALSDDSSKKDLQTAISILESANKPLNEKPGENRSGGSRPLRSRPRRVNSQ